MRKIKVSKIKRPNKIQKYVEEQKGVLSEFRQDLKIFKLKYYKGSKVSKNKFKEFQKVVKNLKEELTKVSRILRQLQRISVKYKVKWFNTYKLSLKAGIIRREIQVNHKHLLKIIKYNRTTDLDNFTIKSLQNNLRRFLLINSQAKSLVV